MNEETAEPIPESPEKIEEEIVSAQPSTEIKTESSSKKPLIVGSLVIIFGVIVALIVLTNPGNVLNLFKSQKIQTEPVSQVTPTVEAVTDSQLDKDLKAMDIKINSLDTDFSNIDSGLSDKSLTE